MKAVIMAGGRGNRLLPHTDIKPKCLLPVHGQSILDYQLKALELCGITDIAIITRHCYQTIIDHVKGKKKNITIIHNNAYKETNSSYGAWLARDYVADSKDGFILINSDLIFQVEMLQLLIDHPKSDGIIVQKSSNLNSDMVKIEMQGGRIIAMHKQLPLERIHAEAIGPIKLFFLAAPKVWELVKWGKLNNEIAANRKTGLKYLIKEFLIFIFNNCKLLFIYF
jgi:choline kinase